jgi:hypothetical protein
VYQAGSVSLWCECVHVCKTYGRITFNFQAGKLRLGEVKWHVEEHVLEVPEAV